ncbi:MAG TPA: hypothetical protein VEY71_03680 [Chitinophagales bacterium]|nr:hypothetical protein [Chitinophagales bacterium]
MKPILFATLFLICIDAAAQPRKDLNVDFMVRGYVYAATAVEDSQALGGFGRSGNPPKQLGTTSSAKKDGIYLFVDTTKHAVFAEKYNGYKLFLVNGSNDVVQLPASDSRLSVVAEAFINSKWQPVEYLPRSWCGNSYHRVYLKPDQYWEFDIPRYSGKIKTQLRYKLTLDTDKHLYSNVFSGSVNKNQLFQKQGHNATSILDPYDE